MKDRDHIIIWPEYLDSRRTRSEGRKVPLSIAVKKPTVEEIAKVLKAMGIEPVIELDKKYPRSWWSSRGRIKVRKNTIKKYELLKKLCIKIRESRSEKK